MSFTRLIVEQNLRAPNFNAGGTIEETPEKRKDYFALPKILDTPFQTVNIRTMTQEIIHLLQKAKVFVLDFDGTLVDSNEIKWSAFEKCFARFPEQFETILAYCKNNNHTPRHEKFRHVFEKILKRPYTPEVEKNLLETYASETTEQVIQAAEIPGATQFLCHFVRKKELALLSSTPHDTLLRILESRGWKKYFSQVKGAPVHKATWMKQLCREKRLSGQDVVFIGDSKEDARAALDAGVLHVCVGNPSCVDAKIHIPHFNFLFEK